MVETDNYKNWVTAWNHLTTWIFQTECELTLWIMSDLVYLGMSYMLEAEEIIDTGVGGNLSFSLQSEIIVCSVPSQVSRWLDPKEFHEELCKQERFVSLCLKDSGHFPTGRLFDCRCLQKVRFISSHLSSFYKWYKVFVHPRVLVRPRDWLGEVDWAQTACTEN